MEAGKKRTTYQIYWIVGGTRERPKTGQEILDYAATQGCNVVFLLDAHSYTYTGHYQAFLFNANLVNGDLYLCEDLVHTDNKKYVGVCVNGGTGVVSDKRNRVLRGYDPTYDFYADSYMPNAFKTNISGYGRTYDGISHDSEPNLPTVVLTTLEYNHLYCNDEDITPLRPNWESVMHIDGNDQTWLLSKIFNINNGEPVSNASDGFSLASKTEVDVLVDAVLMDMSKVKVTYSIPEATYSYIKLVYKKDEIPVDETDGTVVNLTQSDTETVITDITDTGIYYFMIFTDKSVSEEVSLRFVAQEEEGE